MKKRFFFKNLFPFIIFLLVPNIILGSLSILITQKYIKNQLDTSAANAITKAAKDIDILFNDSNTLAENFEPSSESGFNALALLNGRLSEFPYMENTVSRLVISNLSSLANTKPYIDSVFVYYERNKDKVLSSSNGFVPLTSIVNENWYKWFEKSKKNLGLTRQGSIPFYIFNDTKTGIVSVFKGFRQVSGCIILNIKVQYVFDILDSNLIAPSQSMFILNKNGDIVFNRGAPINPKYLSNADMEKWTEGHHTFTTPSEKYQTITQYSPKYGWTYVFASPSSIIYSIPAMLIKITLILSIAIILVGLIFAFFIARSNYDRLKSIISIFEAAEKNLPLPPLPNRVNDEYGYILENIIKTFIEKSYLNLQLSEKQYQLRTIEYLALQSQINPHFLYNTLNAVYWEAYKLTGGPNKANTMLENLSEILRYSLDAPSEMVSLEDEFKYVANYMDIQKIRYEGRLVYLSKIDQDTRTLKVMKLILQPLVENSIKHGISQDSKMCIIRIRSYIRKDTLVISIFDNGSGISKDKLSEIKKKLMGNNNNDTSHIGICNTNRRLKLEHGDSYGLKIISNHRRGTSVYINIPIIYIK